MSLKGFAFKTLLLVLALLFFTPSSWAEERRVDNLAQSRVKSFPKDWKTYPFHKNKSRRVYKVQEENGTKFIQAIDTKNISVPIFKDIHWDIKKYPYLKFSWRAQQIPAGSKEAHPDTNDSACGVYVGFSRSSALKYVWSAALPPESFWAKNPGKFYIISKQMGTADQGKWRSVTINVPGDYEKYFGKPVKKNPIGIGLMTDGNAVKQSAACDYTDFRISSTP